MAGEVFGCMLACMLMEKLIFLAMLNNGIQPFPLSWGTSIFPAVSFLRRERNAR